MVALYRGINKEIGGDMKQKVYEEIMERLDRIEKKLDMILSRLPYGTYPWPSMDDQDYTPFTQPPDYHSTAEVYGNKSDP